MVPTGLKVIALGAIALSFAVEENPNLPFVLLVGDSITLGYSGSVRARLKGVANVRRIPDNGRSTEHALRNLDEWLQGPDWKIIHFNFGLHDCARVRDGEPQVDLGRYERNLASIARRLKATGAGVIFATTTPVPAGFVRGSWTPQDVIDYNAAALRVMRSENIPVNDLHSFAIPQLSSLQRLWNVHFTRHGYQVLGGQVAGVIASRLRETRAAAARE